MNQRGCPVCEFWARVGTDGTFDAPHHATCPVPAAAVEMLLALNAVRGDLFYSELSKRTRAKVEDAVNKAEGR